ncbi:MAG: hypothetical protein OXT69_14165 [Candidatus Poribacteria bacterium]|nr:hypothetical protein [Candidatus Poribacteria bacterium]
MSKERLIKTTAWVCVALALTWAGCGGQPADAEPEAAVPDKYAALQAARAEYAALDGWMEHEKELEGKAETPFQVLLASAAPEEWAAYEKAFAAVVKARLAAAPEEYKAYLEAKLGLQMLARLTPEEYATYEKVLDEAVEAAEAAVEKALLALEEKAPVEWATAQNAKTQEAVKKAMATLKASAADEWVAFEQAETKASAARVERYRVLFKKKAIAAIQADILAAYETARLPLKEKAQEEYELYETAVEALKASAADEWEVYEKARAGKVQWAQDEYAAQAEARMIDAGMEQESVLALMAELRAHAEREVKKARAELLATAVDGYAAYLTARLALEEKAPAEYAAYERARAEMVSRKAGAWAAFEEAKAALGTVLNEALVQDALPARAAAAKAQVAAKTLASAAKALALAPGVGGALETYEKALASEAYFTALKKYKASAPDEWAAVEKARAAVAKALEAYKKARAILAVSEASETQWALTLVETALVRATKALAAWHAATEAYLAALKEGVDE